MSAPILIFLVTQFTVIFSALPPIKKCQLSDSSCIKAVAQPLVPAFTAGIPELGTEILDPMRVDFIKVDLSGLKLKIKDAEITGLKNAVTEKLSVNQAKKEIQLVFRSDFTLRGKYKASGKLLILPISGDGDAVMKIKNTLLTVDMSFAITKNDAGKDFIALKSHKYEFDVRDGANFQLSNLFNGNMALSAPMHTFMNANWKTMLVEFGRPVFDKPVQKIYDTIKIFLGSMPLDEITNV